MSTAVGRQVRDAHRMPPPEMRDYIPNITYKRRARQNGPCRTHRARRTASLASRSKVSFTKEFMINMAFLEMPVSGCTCFSTL